MCDNINKNFARAIYKSDAVTGLHIWHLTSISEEVNPTLQTY